MLALLAAGLVPVALDFEAVLRLAVLALAVLRLAVLRLAVLALAVLRLAVLALAVLRLAVLALAVLRLAVLALEPLRDAEVLPVPAVLCARVRAALRALALRCWALAFRVRAALRAAAAGSLPPRSLPAARLSSASRAPRRSSIAERSGFGTRPLPSTFAAALDADRATCLRSPLARSVS